MIIWSVYLYVFCRLRTAIFVPRGKRSDWIFINVFFFLLIYRKRKFCAEPMRERLTFHFGLGTRSVNFRFFFSFLLFFLFVFSNQGKISSCNIVKQILPSTICDLIRPVGSIHPHLYALPKTHKNGVPLRPILSIIATLCREEP